MKLYKVILIVIVMSFILYILMGLDNHNVVTGQSLEPPSLNHLLGTDDIGIDILAQICYGGGYSLIIGVLAASISSFIGTLIGLIAGYFGGRLDKLLMSISDIITSVPQMIILIILGTFLGANYFSLVLVLAFISWTHTARIIRARVIFIRQEQYLKYSEAFNTPIYLIFLKHLLPELIPLLSLSFIKVMSKSIIMEASLAYLGLGNPTSKSWGMMLNRAMSFPGIYFTEFWKWWLVPPLIALTSLVLSLMMFSKELEVSNG